MKASLYAYSLCLLCMVSCTNRDTTHDTAESTTASTGDVAKDWKFSVALWIFHTFNFPEALDNVDSAGVTYIEPNTFHKAGPALKDSTIQQLSPAGIAPIRGLCPHRPYEYVSNTGID